MSKKDSVFSHGKSSDDTQSTTHVNIVGVDHLIAAEKKEKQGKSRYSTNTENYVRSSFILLLLLLS